MDRGLEQTSNGPRGAACLARVLDDVEWRELDATDPKSWLGRTLRASSSRASSSASVYPLASQRISSQAAEIASLADSSPSAHGGSTMTSSKPIASTWGRTAIISLNACGLRAASAPSENHLPSDLAAQSQHGVDRWRTWQMERPQKRLKQTKPVAVGCDRLSRKWHGVLGGQPLVRRLLWPYAFRLRICPSRP
jgi:hypothetical protein